MNKRKLTLLVSLYLSQGLPFGFFTQALPVLLREQGMSLPAIGLTYLLALPWALKFLWAPWVDRLYSPNIGRRRSWILPLQTAAIVILFALTGFELGEHLYVVMAACFALNLIAATQDVATDGLAVELLTASERGLGNGVQVAGYRLGMIVGGGLLLVSFPYIGWAGTMATMAGIVVVATIPVLRHKEVGSPPTVTTHEPQTKVGFFGFWRRPGFGTWFVVLVVYKFGDALAAGMLRPFFVDFGLDMEAIGWMLGLIGFTAGLVGALSGGWWIGRLGRKRALIIFGVLQAITVATYAIPAAGVGGMGLLVVIAVVEHFVGGMATVALFTMMMDLCRRGREGSDYTVQASLVVITTGIAAALGGVSAATMGYALHFLFGGVVSAAALLFISGCSLPAKFAQTTESQELV